MGYIYMITSPSNKSYIGITIRKNINDRWCDHLKSSSHCTLLKKSIKKYGLDNLKKEILLEINDEFLPEYEKKFIKLYDTLAPKGYNCTTGGEGGKRYCEETKQKISETTKETARLKAKGTVYKEPKSNNWRARYGSRTRNIGTYKTKELAEKAVKQYCEDQTILQEGKLERSIGCIFKTKYNMFRAIKNRKHLGTFKTREEAQKCIDEYIKST